MEGIHSPAVVGRDPFTKVSRVFESFMVLPTTQTVFNPVAKRESMRRLSRVISNKVGSLNNINIAVTFALRDAEQGP
jgi:hypothetical protein